MTPSGRSVTSIRHRLCARADDRPSATAATPMPSWPASAAAASALVTLCSPCSRSATLAAPSGISRVNLGLLSASRLISLARTSAPADRPKVTTRAAVSPAMAMTSGSSAFRMATPSAGSDCGSSALAAAIWPTLPNSPACAFPTHSTTPSRGGAIRQSAAMWPGPRADNSATRYLVPASARSTVSGWPISLLKEFCGATVGPSVAISCAARSLVVVLPADPVMPAITSPGRRSTTALARRPSAAGTSSAMSAGVPVGRVPSVTTAPAAAAAAAKSCPSARSPASAANSAPGATWRESITTGPVTRAAWSGTRSVIAPVMLAISSIESGITRRPPAA